jgi:GAF domain-containing protein
MNGLVIRGRPSATSAKRPQLATTPTKRIPDAFLDAFNKLPSLRNVDASLLHDRAPERLCDEKFFDQMMSRCNSLPLNEAFEPILVEMFAADRAVVWEEQPPNFYSASLKSEVLSTNFVIQTVRQLRASYILSSFDDELISIFQLKRSDHEELFFPLILNNGILMAIVQISRGIFFSQIDELRSKFISRKFAIFGASAFAQPRTIAIASQLSTFGNLRKTADMMVSILRGSFSCTQVDFWLFDEKSGLFMRYDRAAGQFLNVYRCAAGIVSPVLRLRKNVNQAACRSHPNYLATVDGDGDFPILICCCEFDARTWAVALRGPRSGQFGTYSGEDEKHLSTLLPFIARSLAYSAGFTQGPPTPSEATEKSLSLGLDAAALFASSIQLDILRINVEEIIAQGLPCEKVRFIVVDNSKPLHGLLGVCITESETINLTNPETDKRFVREVDIGSDTPSSIKSFLAFPITDCARVIGAIVIINRTGVPQCTFDDVTKLQSLSQFVASSINNSRAFQDVLSITRNLRSVIKPSSPIVQPGSATSILDEVLTRAKSMLLAKRATLFMVSAGDIFQFVNVGDAATHSTELTRQAVDGRRSAFATSPATCCVPVIRSDSRIVGAVELECLCPNPTQRDLDLLESFASLGAMSLERWRPDELLSVALDHRSARNDFESIFETFDRYSLNSEFMISERRLLMFCRVVAQSHVEGVYQDWSHAVKVFEFARLLISLTKTDSAMTRLELLGFFVAALCHDVGISGFGNLSVGRAVLVRCEKAVEMKSCRVAMGILSRDDCNIFSGLNGGQLRDVWAIVVDLLLATHFMVHAQLVSDFNAIVAENALDAKKERHRRLLMKLFLKAADLSVCAEEVEPPSGFFDEIFAESDLKDMPEIKYRITDDDDRENQFNLDKENSRVGILKWLCLPFFESLQAAYPGLGDVVAKVRENVREFARIRGEREVIMPTVGTEAVKASGDEQPDREQTVKEDKTPEEAETTEKEEAPEKAETAEREETVEKAETAEKEEAPEKEETEPAGKQLEEAEREDDRFGSELIEIKRNVFGKMTSDSENSQMDSVDSLAVEPPFGRDDEEFADDEGSDSGGQLD